MYLLIKVCKGTSAFINLFSKLGKNKGQRDIQKWLELLRYVVGPIRKNPMC